MEIETKQISNHPGEKTVNVTVPTSSTSFPKYKQFVKSLERESKNGNLNIVLNTVIDKGEKFSFSKSVNAGFSEVDADYYLNVNDDVILNPNSLKRSVSVLETNPRVGCLGILLLYPNGNIQSAGMRAIKAGTINYYFRKLTQHKAIFDGFREMQKHKALGMEEFIMFQNSHTYSGAKKGIVTGTYHLISKEALNDVKGYDENYRLGYEDVDFCLSIISAGLEVRIDQGASAVHYESAHGINYQKEWGYKYEKYLYGKWNPQTILSLIERNSKLKIN